MRAIALGTVLLLVTAGGGSGQVRQGLSELNLSGTFTAVNDGDESETALQGLVRYGYFVSRQVEIGAALSVNKFEGVDTFGSVGAFAAIHFGLEGAKMVPYAGAAVETGYGPDENPRTWGGFGGLRFFVSGGAAINTEGYFSRTSRGELDYSSYGMRLGVSIFL